MTISFDLDDTLIPAFYRFDTQPRRLLQKIFRPERLRLGSVRLMKALRAEGHKIFIYTTSFRSVARIKWVFRLHGIRIDKVINQAIHQKILRERAKHHSKYPPAFLIDVHIDDSKGVEMEGRRHHFNTIIVPDGDPQWADEVLREILLLTWRRLSRDWPILTASQ